MATDQEMLDLARRLIDEVAVGCMVTIGPEGKPYARYMGGVPGTDDFGWLYSLSAHATNKIEHLRDHPDVCWIFANRGYEDVVTLHGKAKVEPTSEMPASIYDRLIEFAKPYAVNVLTDPHHYQFEAVVTQVESIELLAPHLGVTAPHAISL